MEYVVVCFDLPAANRWVFFRLFVHHHHILKLYSLVCLQKKLPLTTLSQTMQEGGGQLGDESLIG